MEVLELGPLIKSLIDHAGPLVTALLLMLVGIGLAFYKIAMALVTKVSQVLEESLKRRDESLSKMVSDFSTYSEKSAVALATINTKIDTLIMDRK